MPPTNIARAFGIIDDGTVGGKGYDDLATSTADANGYTRVVPDANIWVPATGGTLDKNVERIDRNAEARGLRAVTPMLSFRAAPVLTVPFMAYPLLVAKFLKKTMGGVDTVSGSTAAGYLHTIASITGLGVTGLPAFHGQIVRDDLNHKVAGASSNRLALAFPLDGEGTVELEAWGKWHKNDPAPAPTPSFTGLGDDVLMLRDAKVYVDGSTTSITDLTTFEITWVNNLARHFYGGRNIETRVALGTNISSPANDLRRTRKTWYPSENRVGAAQDVTFALGFGSVNGAQELAFDFSQLEQFVFECTGGPIAGTSVAGASVYETLRFTIMNGQWTGGGPDGLSARDDITSRYEGTAFYSDALTTDVKVEWLTGSSVALT